MYYNRYPDFESAMERVREAHGAEVAALSNEIIALEDELDDLKDKLEDLKDVG